MPPTRSKEENYNCIMKIMNVAVCEGLGEIFKQEWDKNYGATKGMWDDTCKSGNDLYNMERTRRYAKPYLNSYQTGKRSEWDCCALFDAILYSNAIKKHLSPHVSNKVDELRELRNKLTHTIGPQHKISDIEFENAYKKVQNCFKALRLSTARVDRITNSFKEKLITSFRKMTYFCLFVFIAGLLCSAFYYWFTNPPKSLYRFRVLPTRPVHLVAKRGQTVNYAILGELHNLSIGNNRSLTHFYISGNPGSGKSQLARLVGERYGANKLGSWSDSTTFVMTLKGTSLGDILGSYADFARRVDCIENNIANIINSNKTTAVMKIQSLKTEIAKRVKNFKTSWLLIVDDVVKLSEIYSFLPQLEDEDWQGGQVLITTQDMSSVPSNSSMTIHISVSPGMNPVESCEFLTDLSGLIENHELVSKVAKELDYQPLALASAAFYVKQLRESKASAQFTWNDYLRKLDEGKRNLTEMRLRDVNKPAYSLTMSTAVLLAVKMFAESDLVIKHAFTFFSYVSHKPQSLQVVVSYVLRVDKGNDKEDVALRICQCSLILPSDDQNVVSVSLHRVVHDSLKLYIAHGTKGNTKSRVPLYVFQSLLQEKCALGEIALIPHLKAFYVRTKNLSSDVIISGTMKVKQKMHKQIFDLTSALIQHGEFLLSKNYLILALKIATNRDNKDKIYPEVSLHDLFPQIGNIYCNLGVIENSLGNTKDARNYYKKALDILSRQHGPSHKTYAKCLINLGSLHCLNPKECDKNIKYSKQAVDIDGSLQTKGIHYSNLGNRHYIDGDFELALQYYRKALEIFQETLYIPAVTDSTVKQSSRRLAILIMNFGATSFRLGKYKVSRKFFTTSIDMHRKISGPKDLNLANSYYNLGLVQLELNELRDAEDCFRRARKIYYQHLGPSHEKIAMVSQNLAAVLERTGQLNEAAVLHKQYGTCRRQ